MSINTRQDLAEFCLRQLGGGVVNIEITDEQLEDAVELALEWYNEFHYDGVERDFLAHKITASVLTVASTTGLAVGQTLTNDTTTSYAAITALTGTTITIGKITGYQKFAVADVLTNGVISVTLTVVALGDLDNGYVTVDDSVVGVKKILNISSTYNSSDFLFNPQYQIMMNEIYNLTSSGGVQYYYSVMNYMAHLDFILKKEKDFRFNRRWNRLYIDVNWGSDIKIGDIVVVEVYKALNDVEFPEILNDRWLKEYTTALVKRQWGTNLKKYKGMTLPGGLQYDGQAIYDEAISDIEKIQDQAIGSSAPLFFEVG